jgi:hypothetical protein
VPAKHQSVACRSPIGCTRFEYVDDKLDPACRPGSPMTVGREKSDASAVCRHRPAPAGKTSYVRLMIASKSNEMIILFAWL